MIYQNCSDSIFKKEFLDSQNKSSGISILDADCSSPVGCVSASSLDSSDSNIAIGTEGGNSIGGSIVEVTSDASMPAQDLNSTTKAGGTARLDNGMPSVLADSAAVNNSNSDVVQLIFYNFVSASKKQCEEDILAKLNVAAICSIGGGCGVGCGKPNGEDCFSANPKQWGACIETTN